MGTFSFFRKIQGLPMDYLTRTLWSHDLENCKCTEQLFLNEPLRNIIGTSFRNTQGLPMNYLTGTLQSQDLEYKCTGHFLH